MASKAKILNVFIGSPGDVTPERKAADAVIAKVSEHYAKGHSCRIEARMWERDVLPAYGKEPQAIVNDRMGYFRQMDLCVFIMRDRYGTPTQKFGSGTEEEYQLSVQLLKRRARPAIWVCFGEQSTGLKGAQAIQQGKVREFRDRVSPRHIRFDFKATAGFRKQFERFLTQWVSEYFANDGAKATSRNGGQESVSLTTSTALLLGDRIYRSAKPREESGRWVVTIQVRTPAEDRALRALSEGYQAVPYAFGLVGGMVRISRVEFGEEKGREVAFVRFDAPQAGGGMGSTYGGDDAARDAGLRRVLLGETTKAELNPYGVGTREEGLKAVVPSILAKSNEPNARLEARLRAVQALFEAGLVSEIEQLTIGTPTEKGVKVTFVGRARTGWGGDSKPVRIEEFLPKGRVGQKRVTKPKKA